ncbi:MAG: hypothetical protein AB1733_16865 [Thermodesulfobacteriota bacterium]
MAILGALVALFLGAIVDSLRRNGSDALLRDLKAVSYLLPSADPGMNNSARYIRHLGLSTPASAFPDYPGQPDYLPSGMMWPPLCTFVGIRNTFSISDSYAKH